MYKDSIILDSEKFLEWYRIILYCIVMGHVFGGTVVVDRGTAL